MTTRAHEKEPVFFAVTLLSGFDHDGMWQKLAEGDPDVLIYEAIVEGRATAHRLAIAAGAALTPGTYEVMTWRICPPSEGIPYLRDDLHVTLESVFGGIEPRPLPFLDPTVWRRATTVRERFLRRHGVVTT